MRLYVPLNRQEYEALERLAYAERRRPQDQAAVLIVRTLADRSGNSTQTDEKSSGVAEHEHEEAERVSA